MSIEGGIATHGLGNSRSTAGQAPTLLVASTGGHLEQLFRLHKRFEPALGEVEWATFDTNQSRHLLRDQSVTYLPFVKPKDLSGTVRNVPVARHLLRTRPFGRVVSTGAAVAVPFLAQARLLGLGCHYVESAARSEGPSMSGHMVARIPGVRTYSQYPRWAAGRWQYRGAVFDGFRPGECVPRDQIRSVVVTFGTQRDFGFRRAAERLVAVLPDVCSPDAEILWQTGVTDASGLGIDSVESVPASDLQQAIAEADLVISHSGVGTALVALERGRCPVMLPRRADLREHTDDHQRMIAEELDRRGLAVNVDPDDLTRDHLLRAASMTVDRTELPPPFLLQPD
jgi:UDP-N-acetylglucosamine--N-acetylmuramyl-(pentapeptide) pyrophosphoryl-undecaprenol N-acetylglucosamine transferase